MRLANLYFVIPILFAKFAFQFVAIMTPMFVVVYPLNDLHGRNGLILFRYNIYQIPILIDVISLLKYRCFSGIPPRFLKTPKGVSKCSLPYFCSEKYCLISPANRSWRYAKSLSISLWSRENTSSASAILSGREVPMMGYALISLS